VKKQIDNNFHGLYSCQPYSRPRNDVKMFRKLRALILLVAFPPPLPWETTKQSGVFLSFLFFLLFSVFLFFFLLFFSKLFFFLILSVHPCSRTIIIKGCFADCAKFFPIFVFNYHNTCVVCCRSVWKAYDILSSMKLIVC